MAVPLVALLTDFGEKDWYVGSMRGVIQTIAPGCHTADITHEVPAFDVRAGALMLEASYNYFPERTVFCCVVDPGVGSARNALVATDGYYFFVAPDNGLLTLVLKNREQSFMAWRAVNSSFMLPQVSQTFQGRDVFAPLAAHLARGVKPAEMGELLTSIEMFDYQEPRVLDGEAVSGEVIYIDQFGNVITNIRRGNLIHLKKKQTDGADWLLQVGEQTVMGLAGSYHERPPGEAVFYWGSAGYLELAVNQSHAAEIFQCSPGTPVRLILG